MSLHRGECLGRESPEQIVLGERNRQRCPDGRGLAGDQGVLAGLEGAIEIG